MPNIITLLTGRLLGVAIATAALITPALASAQDYSAYDAGASQQIQGTVAAINGTWNITVADANGYADSVQLHQGTIINPTGLTLQPGMSVTIDGYADGPNFDAMEIDTPYQYQGPTPVAVYYGPGAWYPGYANGWGPSFSLVFNFGSRRFERREFYSGGEIRRPEAPPSGWQNRPHGYIGNAGGTWRSQGGYNQRAAYSPPQNRGYSPQQPTRNWSNQPQQQPTRNWSNAPQQQPRNWSAPPQQTAPQQRTWGTAPQQQPRNWSAPPQQQQAAPQRNWAPPQQSAPQRNWAPPQQSAPQQVRGQAAPAQQARSYTAPSARVAPDSRNNQDNGRQHGG